MDFMYAKYRRISERPHVVVLVVPTLDYNVIKN
jgi:hypothetical protein